MYDWIIFKPPEQASAEAIASVVAGWGSLRAGSKKTPASPPKTEVDYMVEIEGTKLPFILTPHGPRPPRVDAKESNAELPKIGDVLVSVNGQSILLQPDPHAYAVKLLESAEQTTQLGFQAHLVDYEVTFKSKSLRLGIGHSSHNVLPIVESNDSDIDLPYPGDMISVIAGKSIKDKTDPYEYALERIRTSPRPLKIGFLSGSPDKDSPDIGEEFDVEFPDDVLGITIQDCDPYPPQIGDMEEEVGDGVLQIGDEILQVNSRLVSGLPSPYESTMEFIKTSGRPLVLTIYRTVEQERLRLEAGERNVRDEEECLQAKAGEKQAAVAAMARADELEQLRTKAKRNAEDASDARARADEQVRLRLKAEKQVHTNCP